MSGRKRKHETYKYQEMQVTITDMNEEDDRGDSGWKTERRELIQNNIEADDRLIPPE